MHGCSRQKQWLCNQVLTLFSMTVEFDNSDASVSLCFSEDKNCFWDYHVFIYIMTINKCCCCNKWLFITTWLRIFFMLYCSGTKAKPCKWILSSVLLFRQWVQMQEILLPVEPNVAILQHFCKNLQKQNVKKTPHFQPQRPPTTTS